MARLSITILIIALLGALIAGLATILNGSALWDPVQVRTFQGAGGLKGTMTALTTLGAEGFFLLMVTLVFWCINKPAGVDLGLLLLFTGGANITVKALLKHARPFWSEPSLQLSSGPSFSLPSGHTSNAAALFGYLAWKAAPPREADRQARWRWLLDALLLSVIFLVALSRVYLGVHFPGDVIWGAALGLSALALYLWLKPFAVAWLCRLPIVTHVLLAAAVALAVLALNALFLAIPVSNGAVYGQIFSQAQSEALGESASLAGMILGVWVGLALEARCVCFTTAGSLFQRALRYVLGLIGLLALWVGLQLVFPTEPPALGMALRVVRYASAGLWTVFGWPWVFTQIGLTARE